MWIAGDFFSLNKDSFYWSSPGTLSPRNSFLCKKFLQRSQENQFYKNDFIDALLSFNAYFSEPRNFDLFDNIFYFKA